LDTYLERGPTGRRLATKVPIDLSNVPRNMLDVAEYVIKSLSASMPSAIPFVLKNVSVLNLAKHLKRHKTSSPSSLVVYVSHLRKFCEWYGVDPNGVVAEFYVNGEVSTKAIDKFLSTLDDYIGMLQSEGVSPSSVNVAVHSVRTFLKVNGIYIPPVPRPRVYTKYYDRAPTPEELSKLIDIADLREKVVISMLALGGFRIGTLAKLKYRHVKRDLEGNVVPLHIHVEADIVKGKFADYDTFVGEEAVHYLKLYLDSRRKGTEDIPPEDITDESPLIRARSRKVAPVTKTQLCEVLHKLFVKAGIASVKSGRWYDVRVHSLRKYFRTQMAAAGVPTEYIEYMMGHKISTYHDIKMKGVEFLRSIYRSAGISIRPRAAPTKIEMLKEMIRSLGYDPEKILVKEALMEPHRTVVGEDAQIVELRKLLKEAVLKEMMTEFNKGCGQ